MIMMCTVVRDNTQPFNTLIGITRRNGGFSLSGKNRHHIVESVIVSLKRNDLGIPRIVAPNMYF